MNDELNVSKLKIKNTEKTTERIFLVDGHSYLYRAFYATPYLSNSKGIPTNATYAFLSMIKKLLKEETPDRLIVVFDSKTPSFREEICKEYKAQRQPMPDNLSVQIPYVKTILYAMGLPVIEKDGFEADDIIGTLVERLKDKDNAVYIVTGDKDMTQLVTKNVLVLDKMKNLLIGENEVIERFGVKPTHIIDYLALCGDASDNIPGAPGIGEKTARELISSFGTIDDIYNNIDHIKKTSVKNRLLDGKKLVLMSKQLATIRLDVPIEINIDELRHKEPDFESLRNIFKDLEFTTLYMEIKTKKTDKKNWQETTLAGLNLEKISLFAYLTGNNTYDVQLESFSAFDGNNVFYSQSKDDLNHIITNAGEIITHNLKPILTLLLKNQDASDSLEPSVFQPPDPSRLFDTMLAAYLINPLKKDYSIRSILDDFLETEITIPNDKNTIIESASSLFELKDVLYRKLFEMGLTDLFFNIEIPLIEVLAHIEYTGVKVQRQILIGLSRDFDKRLNTIIKEIHTLADEPFNINSPQQLSRILFEKLQLPTVKKTKTGFSTDTEVLETLSAIHPLPQKILSYRTLSKLKSTYIDVLPNLINPRTGRIHASFNQMVVATGRLSSSDPNLQNIPIRGEEGKKIREAFVPGEGFVLLSSDYSQIELRILAHISKDPLLIDSFNKNEDIHAKVAQEVFGVQYADITQDMRRTAKVINFGIIYGMSGYGLAKELGVSQREAQNYIDAYFERYKGVKNYIERILKEARSNGFVKTMFGRIRYVPEINNHDNSVRQVGERIAMNTPIQGTAADIIKLAMVSIHRKLKEKCLCSHIIMQIHDELVLEVKDEETETVKDIVRTEMENVIKLSVPLNVSLGLGKSWAEAHD
ncbi:MAG TPA: DNA polymerase I [Syntrophorhabdaceae bacterium]|nr:DNA polymerase I [Syntrophorhabdaceae bacterium]MDI9561356.1 DNA polymerase I [Pseudomonadota bacterium]OQC47269.1 MAG: DNA polymerase I [Deltaproteobacteria bacterium ADurb.Bin026]MBV6505926.1 DNA polymerase I [Syntrophorhabdaceae bacterium]HOG39492.1 DNA polymerase I [Syntrophorhabdaceae bacterium]